LRDALEIMLSRLSTASRQPRHGHGGMSLTARRPTIGKERRIRRWE